MSKFEKDPETGEYVCPACERKYGQYNSLFKHFDLKHGGGVHTDSGGDVDKTDHRLTEAVQEPLETVEPRKIRRVRLNPVIPSVKKPEKKHDKKPDEKPGKKQKERGEDEARAVADEGGWLIPGLIRGSRGKKQEKKQEVKEEHKWYLIKGVI